MTVKVIELAMPGTKPNREEDAKMMTSSPSGLTQPETTKRLTQYDPNALAEKMADSVRKSLTDFGTVLHHVRETHGTGVALRACFHLGARGPKAP